ncbi:DUF4864 domain-containing protein [Ponticoccus sp. SC2-23]|uniref:DUF4864 domain-containing protein n=1 Tax=Alexandriicola marinus TaxID=2081710 RepID=UPI000FD6E102|nr:DUF4864 domain-containing protein [Alexandriicola marinus]MBM1220015.1 DUF4864 domain-containing protein [Ponticoccus sp. SC6-9]MBM1224701.1 DUF4864 domain-containing protein [Ponticoccus sp. SC6-15]MBM1228214.1 DUF4864 domain-containing protein [Ponticoccus sp. SC6-38]MBM1234148.1 DUF4864 domain-containing protein [Ponticoccus sp. SC6-45]MBM1238716.1 DUF4864 domain-containing protein [Ponticoccus sp. SC6-49]MBM1242497.1 DUF4864 domain-containing protein [Ponticoccus sp. SC2-64]MBM1247672
MAIRFALLALFLALAAPAQAQDRAAIEETITAQLDAFNARDVPSAWEYASPMIQSMFGNSQNFGMMVQQGYPMVWTNSDARFLELREVGGRLWQKVMIRDSQGVAHILDYQMVETENGWQINGVQVLPAPEMGV